MTLVTPDVAWPLRATYQVAKTSGSAATGAIINRPPMIFESPTALTIFSVENTVKYAPTASAPIPAAAFHFSLRFQSTSSPSLRPRSSAWTR